MAIYRRAMSVLCLALLACLLGGALSSDLAFASPRPVMAGSSPGTKAGGGTTVLGEHFDGFCVRNFAPDSTVKVVNELTGATATIHTNAKGHGCAQVPIKRGCHAVTQRLVATGTGMDGKPARVSAVVTAPATASLCASRTSSNSGGTLPFTGANIAVLVVAGLLLIGAGTAVTVTVRRRQQSHF